MAILGLRQLTMRDTSRKLLYSREYVTRIQLNSRQDWRTIRIGSRALVDFADSLEVRSATGFVKRANSSTQILVIHQHVKRQRRESAKFNILLGILRYCNRDLRTELGELFSPTLGN